MMLNKIHMALAAKAAVRARRPPNGCIHHSDRGSQYASGVYRSLLAEHDLIGSMGRRGNPYDNAKAESFMKTLKVEAVYLMDYETFEDVTADLHASSTRSTTLADSTQRSAISAQRSSRITTPGRRSKLPRNPVRWWPVGSGGWCVRARNSGDIFYL